MLFNEKGELAIDEVVLQRPTYKAILEDGIVEDVEVKRQIELVISLLWQAKDVFNKNETELLENILAETCVLYAIGQYKNLQDLTKEIA